VERAQVEELKEPKPELDHVMVSPLMEPVYPETVAVQVDVSPIARLAGEHETDVDVEELLLPCIASAISAQSPLFGVEQFESEADVQSFTARPDCVDV
jgi:hypothetical protein